MVKPQERLFMQSKRLHKESFLWNDLFHDKNKSEPIANRRKVRIYSLCVVTSFMDIASPVFIIIGAFDTLAPIFIIVI